MENVRPFPHQQADSDGLTTRAPHDAEAEAMVLCAVLHSADAYQACAELLDRTDFYLPPHRLIWDIVAGLVAAGTPPHPALVRAEIERQGRLHEVQNGQLIYRLAAEILPASSAPHFAEQVAEKARERRFDEHANALKAAISRGATGDELGSLVADFQQAEQLREATGHGPAHLVATLLDWGTFFATDFGDIQLLPGRLMAPGQQITVVGDGKAGKSLFTQEWMWRMATGQSFLGDKPQEPVRILYLDAENGQEQVQERFLSFGAGPRSMGELRYASFPPVRPLDTAGGGADLMALVKATQAQLVVIDTVSRFISGPENDADTWLSLYRHTLLPLKRDRISSVRLDHRGKDSERGARGSSAKTQDVDHVWELSALGGGALSLKRTHTRTGIGPDHFDLVRQARKDGDNWAHGGTRHILMTWENEPSAHPAVPGTVEHIIASLDAAGLPDDAGNRTARQALADRQIPGSNDKIAEAVRRRKARSKKSDFDVSGKRSADRSDGRFPETFPGTHPGTEETAGQTFPGTPTETPGTPPVPHVPPSKRGNGEGTPEQQDPETPSCTVCNTPLHGYRLDRGYTTCLEHDTDAA
ncbi:AAA family ATPase [Streptomyces sp. NPDC014779]|uniref:AAA family ATPase n=1 Tax=Streptomyces sp. NPDC014779 TaxID=3364911 RepID=UPI0036FF06B0